MQNQNAATVKQIDIVVIGAGPAGLAAAIAAKEQGIDSLLVVEREDIPGGVLRQCIHNGFGLHRFNEELTGPEYAQRGYRPRKGARYPTPMPDYCVVRDSGPRRNVRQRTARRGNHTGGRYHPGDGLPGNARAAALAIPGTRCTGIYSAGTAQKFVNLEGYMPGRRVVIPRQRRYRPDHWRAG